MPDRNPRYNGKVGLYPNYKIEKMGPVCNNAVVFTAGTPSIWYKAGPTASTNTNGFNTITTTVGPYNNLEYTWWYDFSGGGRNLTPFYSYARFQYSLAYTKNDLYYFGSAAGGVSYMSALNTDISSTSGKGTVAMVWKTAPDNVTSIWAFAKPANSLSRGYIMTEGYATILGDTQTYVFSNTQVSGDQWNITIVSVDSAGNPNTYMNNGVQGSTGSYTVPMSSGSQPVVAFDNYNGGSVAEFMWFANPLTSVQCTQLETYLKERFCIDY